MRNAFCFGRLVILAAVALHPALGPRLSASPPPEKALGNERPAAPNKEQSEIRWHLNRNFAHGMLTKSDDGKRAFRAVRAVDVSKLDQKQRTGDPDSPVREDKPSTFAVWSKHFDDHDLKSTNGYACVVDENVFTDLRMVRGQDAATLDDGGVVVGRVKLTEYDPVELVRFLVASGIVDANIHIEATVTGSHHRSEAGDWFALHSDDPYWTNRANHERYDFGIHIASDGTIRLINRQHIGRPPPAAADKR